VLLLLGFLAVAVAGPAKPAAALSSSVVISQVYGGGGNTGASYTHDFIELFNRGSSTFDLTGLSVQYASATGTGSFGASSAQLTELPSMSLDPGQYLLIQEASNAPVGSPLPTADVFDGSPISMAAAAGKVALVSGITSLGCNGGSTPCGSSALARIIDLVGYGDANFYEGAGPAAAPSASTSALRKANGCRETDNNGADFAVGTPTPRTALSPFNVCMLTISIDDVSLNEGNTGTTSFDFTVSLSDPAGAGGVSFDISTADGSASSTSDYIAKSLTGQTIAAGSSTYTFSVLVNGDNAFEGNESFFVNLTNVTNATVDDGQGVGTILDDDSCAAPFTPIPAIQGSGSAAAITGTVTTQGVVVGDYEYPGSGATANSLRGFYLQAPVGDGDAATSDAIFVFNGNNNSVSLGDLVRVTGTAGEFQDQTQVSATSILGCGTGTVAPVDVTFPRATATDLEPYEGMLVALPQTMYVTEHFQLGRFGQVVLSANGRLAQPTNVVAPGAPAQALQADNNLNRIILDDASQAQNPDPIVFARNGQPLSASNTLRGGDTATGIVGVMSYTWAGNAASGNAFRVRPINALGGSVSFVAANERPASPPAVGGTVRVVGMNLLNFFNTFNDGSSSTPGCFPSGNDSDCRGANTATEFVRQYQKTVAAILAMNPDVLGVNEIENDGYGPTSALQTLVGQLNAATAPGTYAFIDVDADTGQTNAMGTDAIKVGMLYKPAVVTPVGQTAVLNSVAFVNGGDGAPRSRPSLAHAFEVNATGARFVVDVNHLKSKGSACDAPDAGDGQGNCNQVRVNAATELVSWLATDPTGTGDPDVLLIGDYNSYAKEDPITVIRSAGYTNLIESIIGAQAYSYVFDGQWGYLDHALGSPSIVAQVNGVAEYHINADEPSVLDYNTDFKSSGQIASLYAPDQYRVSDHDPVIVGLTPNAPPTVDAGGPYSVDEGSSITLSASGSGPNADALTYEWDLDNDGTFETSGQSVSLATFDGPLTLTVKVRATDPGGLSAVDSATVTVVNVAPTVSTPTTSPSPSLEGASVVASASFTDPAGNLDAPFTCTVDYGDGSGAQPGSVTNGSICTGTGHVYATQGSYTVTVAVTDVDGSTGTSTGTHSVIFNFSGFFSPIANLPSVNAVSAGQSVPVKFSLGGDKGLSVFAAGSPAVSGPVDCAAPSLGATTTAAAAGGSGLQYDSRTQQYSWIWKTNPAWAGTCRLLLVTFVDGTTHAALFRFS